MWSHRAGILRADGSRAAFDVSPLLCATRRTHILCQSRVSNQIVQIADDSEVPVKAVNAKCQLHPTGTRIRSTPLINWDNNKVIGEKVNFGCPLGNSVVADRASSSMRNQLLIEEGVEEIDTA
jgi:hypothetical protein